MGLDHNLWVEVVGQSLANQWKILFSLTQLTINGLDLQPMGRACKSGLDIVEYPFIFMSLVHLAMI